MTQASESSLTVLFNGLLGFYLNDSSLRVGILQGAEGHSLKITQITVTGDQLSEEPIAVPREQKDRIKLVVNAAPDYHPLTRDPAFVPVDFFRSQKHRSGSFAPSFDLQNGVLSTDRLHEVTVVRPGPPPTRCRKAFTFTAKVHIPLPPLGATLRFREEQFEFRYAAGTNYWLLVANDPSTFFNARHRHFDHYYDIAFPHLPFGSLGTIERAEPADPPCPPEESIVQQAFFVVPKYPCPLIEISNPPELD